MPDLPTVLYYVTIMLLQFHQLVLPVIIMILSSLSSLIGAGLLVLAALTIASVALILHILFALAIARLAKSYGVSGRWMAWLPVANAHLLGKVADVRRECDGKKPRNLAFRMTAAAVVALTLPGVLTMLATLTFTVTALVYSALITIGALVLIGLFVLFAVACVTLIFFPEITMVFVTLGLILLICAIFAVALVMDVLGFLLDCIKWALPLGVLASALVTGLIQFVIYLVTAAKLMTKGGRVAFTLLSVFFPLLTPIFLMMFGKKATA